MPATKQNTKQLNNSKPEWDSQTNIKHLQVITETEVRKHW